MPKPLAQKKGDLLENAVHAIEETILRAAPGFAEGTFQIQSKRIVLSAGVRHEIDLFVTVSLPTGYEAIFIFECKNWESKVGKNEIIVFSEKIAAVCAQRGFFVARSFTKDAKAQAAKNSRIHLLTASYMKPVTLVQFPQMLNADISNTSAAVKFAGFRDGDFPSGAGINLTDQLLTVNDACGPAKEYIDQWVKNIRDEHVNRMPIADTPDGEYKIDFADQRQFEEGAAFLGDKALRAITLKGAADVLLTRASVRSVFEVKTRGRLITVGIDTPSLEIRADIVELG